MDKKSYISVKALLILSLAVILIIGVILGTQMLLPVWGAGHICVTAQETKINDMNGIADEVKRNGITQSNVGFKVEYCVECMWYDSTNNRLAVMYTSNPDEPIYYTVSLPWIGIESDLSSCTDDMILTTSKTCIFEISVDSVEYVTGC